MKKKQDDEAKLKPGDVVTLQSGGPVMTVESFNYGGEYAMCCWFGEDGQFYNEKIATVALKTWL